MYECEGFITQNKQSHLPDIALTSIGASTIPFVAVDVGMAAAALVNPSIEEASKRNSTSRVKGPDPGTFLMSKTRNAMNTLLEKIAVTDALTYALCMSTSKSCKEAVASPSAFASTEFVKDQCKYFALSNLISFAQQGYTYSKPYLVFYQRYRCAMAYQTPGMPCNTPENAQVIADNAEALCKALVQYLLPLLMKVTTTGKV